MMSDTAPSQTTRDAITECTSCALLSKETLAFALTHGAEHAEVDFLRLLMDTADICQTSADFLVRGSPLAGDVCRTTAVICRACAADARAIGTEELQRLAERCVSCADVCETLASAATIRQRTTDLYA